MKKPRCSHSHRAPLNQVRLPPHSGAARVNMLHEAEARLLGWQMCSCGQRNREASYKLLRISVSKVHIFFRRLAHTHATKRLSNIHYRIWILYKSTGPPFKRPACVKCRLCVVGQVENNPSRSAFILELTPSLKNDSSCQCARGCNH